MFGLLKRKDKAGATKSKAKKKLGKAPKAEPVVAEAAETVEESILPRDVFGESANELRARLHQSLTDEGERAAGFVLLRLSQQRNQWSSMPREVWAAEITKLLMRPQEPDEIQAIIAKMIKLQLAVKHKGKFTATNNLALMGIIPVAEDIVEIIDDEQRGFTLADETGEEVVILEEGDLLPVDGNAKTIAFAK